MLFLALAGVAAALEPAWSAPMDGPAGLADLLVGPGPTLVLLGEGALQVRDPRDGSLITEVATGGNALYRTDLDGLGVDDLVVCADEGITGIPWTALPWSASTISAEPCEAVAAQDMDGTGGHATAADALLLWSADWSTVEEAGITFEGAPLLASASAALAAGSLGAAELVVLETSGTSTLEAGGALTGLGAHDGTWRWTVEGSASILDEAGSGLALSDEPAAFAWVDLDCDGLDELVVSYPASSSVGLIPGDGSAELRSTLDTAPGNLATGDLNSDGCDDVAVALPELDQVLVLRASDAATPDGDGDGYDEEDGDCDDADATVHPGAEEACNGRDDDCDGDADGGVDLGITASLQDGGRGANIDGPIDEGETLHLEPEIEGCYDTLTWSLDDPEVASCDEGEALELDCLLLDDGLGTVTFAALDEDGRVLGEASWSFEVRNVAPTLVVEDGWTVEILVDQRYEVWLEVDEPGQEVLTFEVEGGPQGMEISDEGTLRYLGSEQDLGVWAVVVRVADDDGGEDAAAMALRVKAFRTRDTGEDRWDTDSGSGGGCVEEDDSDYGCGCEDCSHLPRPRVLRFGPALLAFGLALLRRRVTADPGT